MNRTVNRLGLINFYRPLHPTVAEYTFFSGADVMFTSVDLILGQKNCTHGVCVLAIMERN